MHTFKPRTLFLIVVAILVILGGVLYYAKKPQLLCRNLSCLRFAGQRDYHLSEAYTDTPSTYRALFTSPAGLLRIDAQKVPPHQSSQELDAAIVRMKGMFTKAPAPYPGELSDAIVCDPAFIPSFHSLPSATGTISYFVGFLNDRLTFGSCSQSQSVYRGLVAFTYCPSSSFLLRFELIAPAATFEEQKAVNTLTSLACR